MERPASAAAAGDDGAEQPAGAHRVVHGLTFASPDQLSIHAVCKCGRWGAKITGYPLPWTWHLYYSHVHEDGCGCDIHRRTIFIGFHPSSLVLV